jgi:hypothetical protein
MKRLLNKSGQINAGADSLGQGTLTTYKARSFYGRLQRIPELLMFKCCFVRKVLPMGGGGGGGPGLEIRLSSAHSFYKDPMLCEPRHGA